MSEIISLAAERNRRENPEPQFVSADQFGRPMFAFTLNYEHAGSQWAAQIWAYDFDDAEAKVQAMRDTLRLDGQLFAEGGW